MDSMLHCDLQIWGKDSSKNALANVVSSTSMTVWVKVIQMPISTKIYLPTVPQLSWDSMQKTLELNHSTSEAWEAPAEPQKKKRKFTVGEQCPKLKLVAHHSTPKAAIPQAEPSSKHEGPNSKLNGQKTSLKAVFIAESHQLVLSPGTQECGFAWKQNYMGNERAKWEAECTEWECEQKKWSVECTMMIEKNEALVTLMKTVLEVIGSFDQVNTINKYVS
ncbi:hypothetical protein BDR04DRAFT_1121699 [Suillus decipiens]|nr:hypothetical protein BDR04DRAFT_1121699 [Suillus decipiens]